MPRHAIPPPANKQRGHTLRTYKAALARSLTEKKEREKKVALLRTRLADEQRRLRKAKAAIALLEWSIRALDGSREVTPSPDRRRVTPLPRGAMSESAMDIFRESAGWMSAEEIAGMVFARYGVKRPSANMLEAGTASVNTVLRQFGRQGLAEHDGGAAPRRWRRIGER